MNTSKLEVRAALDSRCEEFIRDKIVRFDTAALNYFRLHDRTGCTMSEGVWGRCAYPNRKKGLGYRIRCSAAIGRGQFPYPARWPIGSRQRDDKRWEWVWREDKFQSLEEAFVWIAGHEAYHWLRHSRQVEGRNVETQANQYGYAWLDEWRGASGKPGSETEPLGALPPVARVHFAERRMDSCYHERLAYAVWIGLPRSNRVAFRGKGAARPVYPSDYLEAV